MRNRRKGVFPQFQLNKRKNIFIQKSPKILHSLLYIHVSTEVFLTFVINSLFLAILAFFAKKKGKKSFSILKGSQKPLCIIIRFYQSYFADT